VIAYLDTQIVIWLCQKALDKISTPALAEIEISDLLVSPIVLLELQYLYEIKRIVQPAQVLINQLASQIGVKICAHPFRDIAETALFESWTRDPFDRLIVAHARSNGYSPLVTSDSKIQERYPKAVW